jgi:hypothetical protein
MSHAREVDRRRGGASARRVGLMRPALTVSRHAAVVIWADLVARRCETREACAVMFEVTFQTACNWFDGFSCPGGDKVMQAVEWWPEEFGLPAGDR